MNLIRPAPLPDELAEGYLGRVARLNGWTGPKEHFRGQLERSTNTQTDEAALSQVELLATVAGMPARHFAIQHTTLPIHRAVLRTSSCVGEEYAPRLVMASRGMRPMRHGGYLCRSCVNEDVDFHGFAYWRREHQLPGFFECLKHRQPLLYVDGAQVLLSSPSAVLSTAKAVDERWVVGLRDCSVVSRFHSMCSAILHRPNPFDSDQVSSVLRRRATERGLNTRRSRSSDKHLSSYLVRHVDPIWLASVIPSIDCKEQDDYFAPIDAATRPGIAGKVKGPAYILILSTLFESMEDVLEAIKQEPSSQRTRQEKEQKHDAHQIARAYRLGKGRVSSIAEQLGISRHTALARAQKLGLPAIGKLDPQAVEMALHSVLGGTETLNEAASSVGIAPKVLEEILRVALNPLLSSIQTRAKQTRKCRSSVKFVPPIHQQSKDVGYPISAPAEVEMSV